jgi:hypothetical protein
MIRLLPMLLAACSLSTTPDQAPPPPGVLGLAASAILPGQSLTLTATGVPVGQRVTFLFGTAPGPGPCPPPLGGACLGIDNFQVLGTAVADNDGITTFSMNVPASVPDGVRGYFQAGWIAPGGANLTPVASRVSGRTDGDLLLTELAVTPTAGEFVELTNPTTEVVDLSNVWIADYGDAVLQPIAGGAPSSSDFRVRFPDDAFLQPGASVVVALDGAAAFEATWGQTPDYDLDDADPGAPAMLGSFGGSSGLSNGDEMLVVYRWDGANDFVTDLDYIVWGNTSDAMDRTGLDVGEHSYLPDTPAVDQVPAGAPGDGETLQRCDAGEIGQVAGGNGLGGSDETSENFSLTWEVRDGATLGFESDCSVVPLPVTEVDFELPYGFSSAPGATWIDSDTAFQTLFGVPVPASVDFATEAVLFYTAGPSPFPATVPTVTAVNLVGGDVEADITVQRPGPSCELLDYAPIAYTMVTVPRPTGPVTLVPDITDTTFDCATDGAPEGFDCSLTELCETGALCHSLLIFDGFGFCRDLSESGRFFRGGFPLVDNGSATDVLVVSGLSSVPEDVIISIEVNHPDPSQLSITMTNPLGTPTSAVWSNEPTPGANLMLVRPVFALGDEDVNGDWTLTVTDGTPGGTGSVVGWDLEITSRFD